MKADLPVKPNWNNGWQWPLEQETPCPIFVGRVSETNRIRAFFKSERKGVLIVGGTRGSGKSTTINNVLAGDDLQVNAITIRGVLLEKRDKETLTAQVIKQLVRALYKEYGSRGFFGGSIEGLGELYAMVNATAILSREKHVAIVEQRISFDSKNVKSLVSALSAVFGISVGSSTTLLLQGRIGWVSWVFITLVSAVIFRIAYLMKQTNSFERMTEISELTIHELQVRVGDVIDQIVKKDRKNLVLVFDELDQYDGDGLATNDKIVGPYDLLDSLKGLKLLLNHTKATYVFVLGPKAYRAMLEPGPFETIPTDKLYIPVATPTELSEYVDSILENPVPDQSQREYDIQKRLLLKKSGGNYYRLIQEIRNHLTYTNETQTFPVDDATASEAFTAALFQAAVPIYERSVYRPNQSHENDTLFSDLMAIIDNYESWALTGFASPIDKPSRYENRRVVESYLTLISKIARKPAPDYEMGSYTIGWDKLATANPEDLMRGEVGPILDEEREYMQQYDKILQILQEIDRNSKPDKSAPEPARVHLVASMLFQRFNLSEETLVGYVAAAEWIYDEINTKPMQERREDLLAAISDATRALNSVEAIITQTFVAKSRPLVIARTGEAQAIRGEIYSDIQLYRRDHEPAKSFSSLVSLHDPKIAMNKFNLSGKVIFNPNSIFDIVLGISDLSSDWLSSELYLVRFEGRTDAKNGILYKPSGNEFWHDLALVDHNHSDSLSANFNVAYSGNLLTVRLNNKKVQTLTLPKEPKWLGLANELDEVRIHLNNLIRGI